MKRALITGITGQDGSYLAEFLISKGYQVHGIVRRSSSFNTGRIDHLYADRQKRDTRLTLHFGDLVDVCSLRRALTTIEPHEIYNLGAQSHVRVSFDIPEYTADVTGIGTLRLLEALRDTAIKARFYQASSSEVFGLAQQVPQSETTPFYPRSPYGCAKAFAYWTTVNYREAYKLHASNGILFNHESERRGETFVTRKITRGIARILAGKETSIFLGNLDARRDWGHAKDYVEAMWLMLQQPQGDDFVIATGETHSVREFVAAAADLVGLDWQRIVKIDPRYYRPAEVDLLIGDASKARKILGWVPKTTFLKLVRGMLEADLRKEGLDPRTLMTPEQGATSAA